MAPFFFSVVHILCYLLKYRNGDDWCEACAIVNARCLLERVSIQVQRNEVSVSFSSLFFLFQLFTLPKKPSRTVLFENIGSLRSSLSRGLSFAHTNANYKKIVDLALELRLSTFFRGIVPVSGNKIRHVYFLSKRNIEDRILCCFKLQHTETPF